MSAVRLEIQRRELDAELALLRPDDVMRRAARAMAVLLDGGTVIIEERIGELPGGEVMVEETILEAVMPT